MSENWASYFALEEFLFTYCIGICIQISYVTNLYEFRLSTIIQKHIYTLKDIADTELVDIVLMATSLIRTSLILLGWASAEVAMTTTSYNFFA